MPNKRVVELDPAPTGNAPKFGGTAGLVEDRVRAEMRQVYQDRERPALLDAEGWELLAEGRAEFARLGLGAARLLADGRDTHWFTWRGDRSNDTLVALLRLQGLAAENAGPFVTFGGVGSDAVSVAVRAAVAAGVPDAETLAGAVLNKASEKYDPFLSEGLLCRSYASLRLARRVAKRIDPLQASGSDGQSRSAICAASASGSPASQVGMAALRFHYGTSGERESSSIGNVITLEHSS